MLNGFGDAQHIETLRRLATDHGVRVGYNRADISKAEQIAAMVAETVKTLGSLDILVNNAGVQFTATVDEFPDDQWDQIIAINMSGVFHGMKAAIPGMRAKGWGRIINVASAHGLVASPFKVAYVAAKHGVLGMTKVAAIELANTGVTVNAICPGWVLTPLVEKQLQDRATARHHRGKRNPRSRHRKAADGAVLDARADRRAGRFPLLGRSEDDHRRAVVDRWRLDGAVTATYPSRTAVIACLPCAIG